MRHRPVIALVLAFLLLVTAWILTGKRDHDPRDLRYWAGAGGDKDWSAEAAQGRPAAEFFYGLSFVRNNLVVMIDRVPGLSALPVLGKRHFETTHYSIDSNIDSQHLAEGYRWIKRSADHGFAPAQEMEKVFVGTSVLTNPAAP